MSVGRLYRKILALGNEAKELNYRKKGYGDTFQYQYKVDIKYVASLGQPITKEYMSEWKKSDDCVNIQSCITDIRNKIKINMAKSKYYKKLYKEAQRKHNAEHK